MEGDTEGVAAAPVMQPRLIKSDVVSTVYYLDAAGVRHPFLDEFSFFSRYSDFSEVETVSAIELASYPLGPPILYQTGTLVKSPTDNRVFLVGADGLLHWIVDEAVFLQQGYHLADVKDMVDSFWIFYQFGLPIS